MQDIKCGEINIMFEHVYCTECKYGDKLIKSIVNESNTPIICEKCYPYDPEDSRPFHMRRNYKYKGEWNHKKSNRKLHNLKIYRWKI